MKFEDLESSIIAVIKLYFNGIDVGAVENLVFGSERCIARARAYLGTFMYARNAINERTI